MTIQFCMDSRLKREKHSWRKREIIQNVTYFVRKKRTGTITTQNCWYPRGWLKDLIVIQTHTKKSHYLGTQWVEAKTLFYGGFSLSKPPSVPDKRQKSSILHKWTLRSNKIHMPVNVVQSKTSSQTTANQKSSFTNDVPIKITNVPHECIIRRLHTLDDI